MDRERSVTFDIRAEGLERLKQDLESLVQTLQSLMPQVPTPATTSSAPAGWQTLPSGLVAPTSSLPTAQQAHARGQQATQQPATPPTTTTPQQTLQNATANYQQAQQQVAQASQPAQAPPPPQQPPPPSAAPPPQQPSQQPASSQASQPTQQMSDPTMQLPPQPPDWYQNAIDWLERLSQIGYAGGRMGLGTWGMGQIASGLRTALQSIPALGMLINPMTAALAAGMFLIAPPLNAIGRNLGAEAMAGVTGQGGTTPSTIFFDAIASNPLFRVLTWIPFLGPQLEAAVSGYARYFRAYEAQLVSALLTQQRPLLTMPAAGVGALGAPLGLGADLLGFSPYYSAVELERAADLMLRGFRFQQGIRATGAFNPRFAIEWQTLQGEVPLTTLGGEPSLYALTPMANETRVPFSLRIPRLRIRGYDYAEQLALEDTDAPAPVATPTLRGIPLRNFLIGRDPANILEFSGMLRHAMLRAFPMMGGVVNPIVERVLDELVSAVNTPVMMQLFGAGAVNRWDYALMTLALQGDPRLVSLQFATAPDGTNLRDIAWRMFGLQRMGQLGSVETARAQIQLTTAQRFGAIADVEGAFARLRETTAVEETLLRQRIAMVERYAPALMDTPEYRQLLASAEQLSLRLREIAASVAQFRVQVVETSSALATVQAEYGLVIARRGAPAAVTGAMVTRAETLVQTTDARIAALRELQAQVGEVERMQIESQIQQLELQRIAGLESMATPPPTHDWLRRRAASQAMLTVAHTTFAQFADIRALYESLMRQTGERLQAMAQNRERMRQRGLWTEEMETRWRQEAMQQVIELAQYQQGYENRWLDRLVSQVWNAPTRMDAVAAWFTRREASLFYDIVPWAFGGTRERAEWMRETVPSFYRTLIGRLGTQEGFVETAMASLMAGALTTFSGDLRIHIVVEDSGNRLVDAQQVHLNMNANTRAVEQVTVTVPAPSQ